MYSELSIMLIHWSKLNRFNCSCNCDTASAIIICITSAAIAKILSTMVYFRVDATLCTSAAAKAAELALQNDSSCSINVSSNIFDFHPKISNAKFSIINKIYKMPTKVKTFIVDLVKGACKKLLLNTWKAVSQNLI